MQGGDGLQWVRFGAYREVVVDNAALPHTLDGDGGVTCRFGEPDGIGDLVVGDTVSAIEIDFGMRRNEDLFARSVYFGQRLLCNLLETVQRVAQYDAIVVVDMARGSHQQGVGGDLRKHRVFAGEKGVVVERFFQGRGVAPLRVEVV